MDDPKELQALAEDRRRKLKSLAEGRRKNVSRFKYIFKAHTDCIHQQIREWYKTCRKASMQAQPKAFLDLTGKSTWKPTPNQLHHAYSIRYFRPTDSPLRAELDDLWSRRDQQEVVNLLSPFSKAEDLSTGTHLNFHNTFMRWKCLLLTEAELEDMNDWIANAVLEKEEELSKPWKTERGEDALSVENEYIQKYVPTISNGDTSN